MIFIFIFIFNFILKMRRQIREIDRDAFDRKIEKIHVDLDRREVNAIPLAV